MGGIDRDPKRPAREEPARHRGAGDSTPEIPDLDPAFSTPHGGRHVQRPPVSGDGAVGRRFGRNFPLEHVFPNAANIMVPNPRVVSRELMTRDKFKPATILNVLAAAWIQFMVHDWFVHNRSKTETIDIPMPPGDDWGAPEIRVPRSEPDPASRIDAAAGIREPEQPLVGCVAGLRLRCGKWRRGAGAHRRQAANRATGLLPVDPETGIHFSGFTDNWWIGLAMLHTLFTLEHNYICEVLARQTRGGPTNRSTRRRS